MIPSGHEANQSQVIYSGWCRSGWKGLTWSAVRRQVTVAVSVAGSAAVDAAVVVVGAGVWPGVCQPGLGRRLPDVQQTGPAQPHTQCSDGRR